MNHFIEWNNRSYNFIAPLGAGLFYTHAKEAKITPVFLGLLVYSE